MRLRLIINTFLLPLLLAGGAAFAAGPKPDTGALTNARIAQMLRAQVSEKTIILMIRRFPDRLDDTPEALVALRRAGASSALLLELRGSVQAARRRGEESAAADEAQVQPEEADGAEAAEDTVYGPYSLELGYPFLGLKRDFGEYGAEGRLILRNSVKALAARGYWTFYDVEPVTGYAGLEAGYVRFGTGRYSGSAAELSPFLGATYSPRRSFGFAADVSPSLVFLPGGGTDSGFGKIGWVVNLGVFFRLPAGQGAAQEEAQADETEAPEAAPAGREKTREPETARRPRPAYTDAHYEEYAAGAEDALAARDYFKADKIYANLLDSLPENDKRRVYLYERRGWLAAKKTDFQAAKGMYLKAAELLRHAATHDMISVRVYAGLGNAFEKLGDDAPAVRYYERALEFCSDTRLRQQIETRLEHLGQ